MKSLNKRILSMILALVLCLGLFPAALAEEGEEPLEETRSEEPVSEEGVEPAEEPQQPAEEQEPEAQPAELILAPVADAEIINGAAAFSIAATVSNGSEPAFCWQRLALKGDWSLLEDEEAKLAAREAAWECLADGDTVSGSKTESLTLSGLDSAEACELAMSYAYRCLVSAGELQLAGNEAYIVPATQAAEDATEPEAAATAPEDVTEQPLSEDKQPAAGEALEPAAAAAEALPQAELQAEVPDAVILSGGGEGSLIEGDCGYYSYSFNPATGTLRLTLAENADTTVLEESLWWQENDTINNNLKQVIIDEGFTAIGDGIFDGYKELVYVSLPDSLKSIGFACFNNCCALGAITLPESLEVLSPFAFHGCASITAVRIPAGVRELGYYAFGNCYSLEAAVLAEGLETVPDNMFSSCNSLVSASLPSSIREIGEGAFEGCAFTSFKLPDNLERIGEKAFYNCTKLKSLSISKDNSSYKTLNGALFTKNGEKLLQGPLALESFSFPATVKEIAPYAFYGSALKTLNCPKKLYRIGEEAFGNCSSLTTIKFNDGLRFIDSGAFIETKALKSVVIPDSVTTDNIEMKDTFMNSGLRSAVLGEGFTKVPGYMFYNCPNLCSVTLPDSLTEIGERSFFYCLALKSINLPASLKSISAEAFRGLNSVRVEVSFAGTEAAWKEIKSAAEGNRWGLDNALVLCSDSSAPDALPFTLSFNLDGGDENKKLTNIDSLDGSPVTIPNIVPKRQDHVFVCWKDSNDANYLPGETISGASVTDPNRELKLTAQWDRPYYSVTYFSNGGLVKDEREREHWYDYSTYTTYRQYGDSITVLTPESLCKPGCVFAGWNTNREAASKGIASAAYAPGKSYNKNANLTLYAVWKQLNYTFTFSAPTAEKGKTLVSQTINPAKGFTMPKNGLKRTGFVLAGWSLSKTPRADSNNYGYDFAVGQKLSNADIDRIMNYSNYSGETVLYAVWAPVEYQIEYKGLPANAVNPNKSVYTILDRVEFESIRAEGYEDGEALKLYADKKYALQVSCIPEGSMGKVTLYVKAVPQTYTISYKLDGGKLPLIYATSYSISKTVVLPVPRRGGRDFQGWYLNGEKITKLEKGVFYGGNIELEARWII